MNMSLLGLHLLLMLINRASLSAVHCAESAVHCAESADELFELFEEKGSKSAFKAF